MANEKTFGTMISSYFWNEKIRIKGHHLVQLQSLQGLLQFFSISSIPKLTLRTCLSGNVLTFNDSTEEALDYEILSNGTILKNNGINNEIRILTHVKKIQDLLAHTDNEDIILAQLDLLKHRFLSIFKPSKSQSDFEMTEVDQEWISNCIK